MGYDKMFEPIQEELNKRRDRATRFAKDSYMSQSDRNYYEGMKVAFEQCLALLMHRVTDLYSDANE